MTYARAIGHQLTSTKSFVPGHVVGTAILLFGTIGITKALLSRTAPSPQPENPRGTYGKGRAAHAPDRISSP